MKEVRTAEEVNDAAVPVESMVDNFTAFQKTLFVPLISRARESERVDGLIFDRMAIDVIHRLPLSLSKMKIDSLSYTSSVGRTMILDRKVTTLVNQVLSLDEKVMVVNMGCGLCSRFERLWGNFHTSNILWVNVDMEPVIQLKNTIMPYSGNSTFYKNMVGSVIEKQTYDTLSDMQHEFGAQRVIFIAEGLFFYFSHEDLARIFSLVEHAFTHVDILFETANMLPYYVTPATIKVFGSFKSYMTDARSDLYRLNSRVQFISEYYPAEEVQSVAGLTWRFPIFMPTWMPILGGITSADRIVHCVFDENRTTIQSPSTLRTTYLKFIHLTHLFFVLFSFMYLWWVLLIIVMMILIRTKM